MMTVGRSCVIHHTKARLNTCQSGGSCEACIAWRLSAVLSWQLCKRWGIIHPRCSLLQMLTMADLVLFVIHKEGYTPVSPVAPVRPAQHEDCQQCCHSKYLLLGHYPIQNRPDASVQNWQVLSYLARKNKGTHTCQSGSSRQACGSCEACIV